MFTTVTFEAQLVSIPRSGVSLERRAVPDARRDGDHRLVDQPADHRGQRALHPRDDDQDPRPPQVVERREQSVQPGDADVLEELDLIAEALRHADGLGGDREVGAARGDDDDRPLAPDRNLVRSDPGERGDLVPLELGHCLLEPLRLCGVDPGDQHVLTGVVQGARDLEDLLDGLLFPVDDLGNALADRAMGVDPGDGGVHEGQA